MLTDVDISAIKNENIAAMFIKTDMIVEPDKNVMVSVSGGSDSDILIDSICRAKPLKNIHFVFFDTGIEYAATKSHLDYLEDRYKIDIERVKAVKSIPACVKEYGQPFLSKWVSEIMSRLQSHGFDWSDRPYEELAQDFGDMYPLKWWCNMFATHTGDKNTQYNIQYNKGLKEYLVNNPPDFKISSKCCTYAKKKTSADYIKKNNIDLVITGVRAAEGGARALAYNSCFTEKTNKRVAQFRPIFYFTNEDKAEYNKICSVRNSDCYCKWGLKRTGCAGCPFNRHLDTELYAIKEFEPKLHNAICHIFADSYIYTQEYRDFKRYGSKNIHQYDLDYFTEGD